MRSLTLMAWILPTVVSANVWRWLLDGSYGLVNAGLRGLGLIDGDVFWLGKPDTALIAVTLATAWTFAPFAMIMLLAGLQSVPGNLYESARLDGAGAWQQFARITMPLIRPVSLTTLLLLFIYTFKTFDTVFLMTGGGPGGSTTTLPIYAYEQAFEFFKFDTAAVGTTVKAIKDRVPVVQAGGARRVASTRVPAFKLLFGSEFGADRRFGWYAHQRFAESEGRQFSPHQGTTGRWFFPTVERELPTALAEWQDAADAIMRRFGQGG